MCVLLFVKRAFTRYEAAIALMVEIGERSGQIDVLAGMAKSIVLMKHLGKEDSVCECKVGNVSPRAHFHTHALKIRVFPFLFSRNTHRQKSDAQTRQLASCFCMYLD